MKKSVFESELINGMQKELLASDKTQAFNKLGQAVEYINSAVSILDEFGLTSKSDKLLRMLGKFAMDTNVKTMPSIDALLEQGVSISDLKNISKDSFARARINTALRALECSDEDIVSFVGKQNLMSVQDAAETLKPEYSKILDWIQNPKEVPASGDLGKGDEFSISRLDQSSSDDEEAPNTEKFDFKPEEHTDHPEDRLDKINRLEGEIKSEYQNDNYEKLGYLVGEYDKECGNDHPVNAAEAIRVFNGGYMGDFGFRILLTKWIDFTKGYSKFWNLDLNHELEFTKAVLANIAKRQGKEEDCYYKDLVLDSNADDDELIVDEDDDSTFEDGD